MNRGIIAAQVEQALGIDSMHSVTVTEFSGIKYGEQSSLEYERPHRYEVIIDSDLDISITEFVALHALFGTINVTGKFVRPERDETASDDISFYFAVEED